MSTCLKVALTKPAKGDVDVSGVAAVVEIIGFQVLFDDQNATLIDACNGTTEANGSVPPLYDKRGALVLLKKHGEQLKVNTCVWEVECTYQLPQPGQEATPATPDPTGDRWSVKISIGTVHYEEELQHGHNGVPIENTAGDPIGGVTVLRSDEEFLFEFTTNIVGWDDFDEAFGEDGYGTVNSAPITLLINGEERTLPIGTFRFCDYTLSVVVGTSLVPYYRMSIRCLWRNNGWVRQVSNKGLNKRVLGVRSPILDGKGNFITTPVYLQTDGDDPPNVDRAPVGATGETVPVLIWGSSDLGNLILWGLHT